MAGPSNTRDSSIASTVDRLYAAPLDSFTATRKALAAELRASGAADEAKRLATMPKPSRSAWALGQVARRHAAELQAFLAATERVPQAQTRAVKERDSTAIREAGRVFNASIADVVAIAARILEEAGGPATALQRRAIGQTLRAVPFASPEEVDQLVRRRRVGRGRDRGPCRSHRPAPRRCCAESSGLLLANGRTSVRRRGAGSGQVAKGDVEGA
jgi:hypothetical protein